MVRFSDFKMWESNQFHRVKMACFGFDVLWETKDDQRSLVHSRMEPNTRDYP